MIGVFDDIGPSRPVLLTATLAEYEAPSALNLSCVGSAALAKAVHGFMADCDSQQTAVNNACKTTLAQQFLHQNVLQ